MNFHVGNTDLMFAAFLIGFCVWLAKSAEERLFGPWPVNNIIKQVIDIAMRVLAVLFFCLVLVAAFFVVLNVFRAIAGSA